MSYSIEEINKLESELESKNQMLMDAHFQNEKLSDELVITRNQYNKVVEQNKELQKQIKDLEEMYCIGG